MSSLCWEEFLKQARELVQLSDQFKDDWKLIEKDEQEGNAYLTFRQKIRISLEEKDSNDLTSLDMDAGTFESVVEDHQSINRVESNEELCDIEYHIVFSISYQVPVLYFKGYKCDGKPLDLNDAWSVFRDPIGNNKSRTDMLSTLTQSDHPVLFTPFLGLHPCRTANLLSQMGPSANSIITFISLVGPFVGLNLRNEYGLAFHAK